MKKELLFSTWKKAMLPLSFTFASLLNFAFYYLGFAFQENPVREYGFVVGCILFAVLSGLTLLYLFRTERFKLHTWVLLGAVMLYFLVYYWQGFSKYGFDSLLFSYCKQFIVFCLPAFFVGICAAKWRTDRDFIEVLEKLSFFAFPAALIFFNQVLSDSNPFNYGRDLGIIHYMSFSYTLMPVMMAQMIQFADGKSLELPIVKKTVKHPQIVRAIMILIFWIAIYSSGTRGAMVCLICFCVFLILSKLIRREAVKRIVVLAVAMVLLMLFNLYVYAPSGMRWLGRMEMFIEGLGQGEIITSIDSPGVSDKLDDLVNAGTTGDKAENDQTEPEDETIGTAPEDETVATNPGDETDETAPKDEDVETQPGDDSGETDSELEKLDLRSRGTLFKLAIKEFQKSPLFGMGAGGYSEKYQKFPHNAILELLAETGIVGTGLMAAIVIFVFGKLLGCIRKDRNVLYVMLFFLTYAVQANINGTVWYCSALLCALGYGIAYEPQKEKSESPKNENRQAGEKNG